MPDQFFSLDAPNHGFDLSSKSYSDFFSRERQSRITLMFLLLHIVIDDKVLGFYFR